MLTQEQIKINPLTKPNTAKCKNGKVIRIIVRTTVKTILNVPRFYIITPEHSGKSQVQRGTIINNDRPSSRPVRSGAREVFVMKTPPLRAQSSTSCNHALLYLQQQLFITAGFL